MVWKKVGMTGTQMVGKTGAQMVLKKVGMKEAQMAPKKVVNLVQSSGIPKAGCWAWQMVEMMDQNLV